MEKKAEEGKDREQLTTLRRRQTNIYMTNRITNNRFTKIEDHNSKTIIATHWFDEQKTISDCHINCRQNEIESKKLLRKLSYFTQGRFKFKILWSTHQIKTLFYLKDKL